MNKIDKVIHNLFVILSNFGIISIVVFIIGTLLISSLELASEDLYQMLIYWCYFILITLLFYPFIKCYKEGWK